MLAFWWWAWVCVYLPCVCAWPVTSACVCVCALPVCACVWHSVNLRLNSSGGLRFVCKLFIHQLSILLFCGLVWVCLLCGREGRGRGSAYLLPVTQMVMHLDSGSSSSVCECLLQCMGFMSSQCSGLWGELQVSLFCELSALPSYRPVTHGCIIGTVRLWINDKEQLGYVATLAMGYLLFTL